MSYIGRSAKLSRKAQEKVSFIATAGQTVKTGLAYVATFVEVHINGILVTDGVDYTATDGNSITFTVGLNLNDEVTVVSLKTFALADHYNKSEADALLGAKATTANFTSTGIDDNATSTAVTLDSSGNVGIGTSSPWTNLSVGSTAATSAVIGARTTKTTFGITPSNTAAGGVEIGVGWVSGGQGPMKFSVGSERMRIDSSGNVLVGTTSANPTSGTDTGISLQPAGYVFVSKASDASLIANRTGTNGDIAIFKRDGAAVGSIGSYSGDNLTIGTGAAGIRFDVGLASIIPQNITTNANNDAATDLGHSAVRFQDLYLSGGVYLGGTGSANKLDDYEEGTWSPAIRGDGAWSAGTQTYTGTRQGNYVKVGRSVFVTFDVQVTALGTTAGAHAQIGNLPFSHSNSHHGGGTVNYYSSISSTTVPLNIYGAGTQGYLMKGGSSYVPRTNLTNNSRIMGIMTYTTNE